jgi:hypothetical protein
MNKIMNVYIRKKPKTENYIKNKLCDYFSTRTNYVFIFPILVKHPHGKVSSQDRTEANEKLKEKEKEKEEQSTNYSNSF